MSFLSYPDARALLEGVLSRRAFTAEERRACIDEILDAEWRARKSHGLAIVHEVLSWADAKEHDPLVTVDEAAYALVEGGNTPGPLVAEIAMDLALVKARSTRFAAVAARNETPFMLAGYHPRRAAKQGFVALALSVAAAKVAPAGGHMPVFGTNPIGAAFPVSGGTPIVVDMAVTQIAAAEVRRLAGVSGTLPPDVAIDRAGRPTTDPSVALQGAMLPFGGYKGSNVALIVELLAGALAGAKVGSSHPGTRAMLFVVIDPDIFGFGQSFAESAASLIRDMRASGHEVHVPGEAEVDFSKPIEVNKELLDSIRKLGQEAH